MNVLEKILSQSALKELADQIGEVQVPGGVLGIYDDQTGSVVVVGIDRREGPPRLIGWSIHGPCSLGSAVQILRQELSTGGDMSCHFH